MKYSVKLNDFEISKNSSYPDSNYLDSTVVDLIFSQKQKLLV